jgi:hypothetical protein
VPGGQGRGGAADPDRHRGRDHHRGRVVFSIILVTLTLASTQFGPRMLRNFIRDRGMQVTLGTFVATFVYAVLVLAAIGTGSHGDFVPHISVTTTLGLTVIDLAVLIYFIHTPPRPGRRSGRRTADVLDLAARRGPGQPGGAAGSRSANS